MATITVTNQIEAPVAAVFEPRHANRLIERQRIARAGAVAIRGHDDDFPDDGQAPGQKMDARRVNAIVVADQYTHAYSTKERRAQRAGAQNLIDDCTGACPQTERERASAKLPS